MGCRLIEIHYHLLILKNSNMNTNLIGKVIRIVSLIVAVNVKNRFAVGQIQIYYIGILLLIY